MKQLELHTDCRAPAIQDRAAQIGFACLIMLRCQRYSRLHIMLLKFWVVPAIEHRQIKFFFRRDGTPVGYVIWAHLAPDCEARFLSDPGFVMHPSEWNEGGKTWVVDFCFPVGGVRASIAHLRHHFRCEGIDQIFWARRDRKHVVHKVVSCSVGVRPDARPPYICRACVGVEA